MSEFLISNPYLGLSFLISLYFVGYFTISKVASRILIDRSNGIARDPSRFFKFSEFFLDLAGLIIVQVILDKSLIVELSLGFLLNLLMKPLMLLYLFFQLTYFPPIMLRLYNFLLYFSSVFAIFDMIRQKYLLIDYYSIFLYNVNAPWNICSVPLL